jgi:hypothetical protein
LQKIKILIGCLCISFAVKAQSDFKQDSYILTQNLWKDTSKSINIKITPKDSIQLRWVPLLNKLQYVQDHPYNWNDGAMVPAKGWQQLLRVGLHAQWKFIEIQVAPEMVLAQNQLFDELTIEVDNNPVTIRDYYRFYNFIELPERMGNASYNKLSWGQSYIKLHYKNWKLALSNENKWWGPTQRNALLLSNTAAGFPHVSIATEQPIESTIGKFNLEVIAGKLTNGGWAPPNSYAAFRGNALYNPKEDKQRIINGFNLSYQPKWVQNLTIGVEQMYMQYEKDMLLWQDYLPIKNVISRIPDDGPKKPILMTAFYLNYTMPEVKTTIYGEFGWNLPNTTFRNWFLQPDKGYASTWGIKKIFPSKHQYYWELLGELTQVQLLTVADQFTTGVPPSWYLGSSVRQGYTNDGQLLGAGVGPGGSSQTIELNWRKNKNRIGITTERRIHNADYYQYAFVKSHDFRRFYTDFITTLKIDWQFNKYQIGPRLSYMQTNNYEWNLFQTGNFYFIPGQDKQQFMLQFNLSYAL